MNHELKIWQQLGVGVTTYPLPKDIVCELKKCLPDEMQALKYVAFKVGDPKNNISDHLELDGMLATADLFPWCSALIVGPGISRSTSLFPWQ